MLIQVTLKLVSAIFHFFLQMTLKTMKKIFFSYKKIFLFPRYSKSCNFFAFFPQFPVLKGQIKGGLFTMSRIGLHKLTDVIFGITEKHLYITSSKLIRKYIINIETFLKSYWSLVPSSSYFSKSCLLEMMGSKEKNKKKLFKVF